MAPVRVDLGRGFLVVVAGEGAIGPLVPIRRHLAATIEVVEQHKATRQSMRVGCDGVVEQGEARVAIRAGYVAEHLIVGAVLSHDVDDVVDRRGGGPAGAGDPPRAGGWVRGRGAPLAAGSAAPGGGARAPDDPPAR